MAWGPSHEERTTFEFDLSALTLPAVQVRRALVIFYRGEQAGSCNGNEPCPDPSSVDLYGFAGDGLIGLDDFAAGAILGTVAPPPAVGSTLAFDVTELVQDLIAGGDQYAGFTVRPGSNGGIFLSGPTLPPEPVGALQIEAVPEPATLLLVGLGLVGVSARRRRC